MPHLGDCLDADVTPAQWYAILNDKVFFWVSLKRLQRLLDAKAYRSQSQTIITLRTASLVAAHRDRILLSPINSGSTIMRPQPRGRRTFLPVSDYPFDDWRRRRTAADAVVELVVSGGVEDVASMYWPSIVWLRGLPIYSGERRAMPMFSPDEHNPLDNYS